MRPSIILHKYRQLLNALKIAVSLKWPALEELATFTHRQNLLVRLKLTLVVDAEWRWSVRVLIAVRDHGI
jgi:hypothetical protein